MTLHLPVFTHFVMFVVSYANLANGKESNIKVPNDSFSRFFYTWEIMECESRLNFIYAPPLSKNLLAMSINGSHYTLVGETWTKKNMTNYGITEPVHSFNADFLVSLYWTQSGKVYTLQQSGPQLIGTVMDVNSVMLAKGQGTNNTEILTSSLSGFQSQEVIVTVVVNATDISCTILNQSCWYLEGYTLVRYFRWQNSSQDIEILATLNVTQDEFVSISVHETELWLITADGLRAWRRLGISYQNPVGKRWLIFHLHLPYPVTSIAVGAAGIFVLMKEGIVAKFQGFEGATTNKPTTPLFQIDTYDNRSVFAITKEGQTIQSKGITPVASGYGRLMEYNRTTKSWLSVPSAEHQVIKNVAVGESEVFVLKNGTDASVSLVDFASKSIVEVYSYDFLSVLEIGAGAKGNLFLINESSTGTNLLCKNTSGYFIPFHPNTVKDLSSISCGKYHCWIIMNNGSSAYIFINQSDPCSHYMPANQLHVYEEGLTFMTIDTDRNGMAAGIEKDSGDIFVRFGVISSSLKGQFWTNLPGTTLKDIASGKDAIYGLDMNGDFLHFVRKDGNWTTWAQWSPCSASCNYGTQSRVRFCNRPAPVFGGKNCTGDGIEMRSCYQQNCTGHEWGAWSSWSSCNGSCPYGQMRRTRVCVEALNSNINNCLGLDQEIFNCPIQCNITETVFIERGIRHSWQDAVKGLLCTTQYTSLYLLSTVNYVMMYFENITLPRTAIVVSSYVQFTAKETVTSENLVSDVSFVLDAWNASREDFESCSFSGFSYSTPIPWTALEWVDEDRGPSQRTPDLYEKLQETIAQPDWNGTGPIIVALKDISSGWRKAYSFDGDPMKSPSLFIKYNITIGVPYTTFWTNWSTWSSCSFPCFGGVQNRTRRCMLMNESVEIHSAYCNGSNFEECYCNIHSCYDASNCTLGLQSNGNTSCCMLGMEMHDNVVYEECTFDVATKVFTCPFDRYGLSYGDCAPINGHFTQWSPWSQCSHNCFTGIKNRTRSCASPAPKYGGSPCFGIAMEQEYCNTHSCYDLLNCTKAVDYNGNISCCMDSCVYIPVSGFRCNISNLLETGLCVPIDGILTTWSSWSVCDSEQLCRSQAVSRTRSCSNPAPLYGGRSCIGQTTEWKICDTGCIPDGVWSDWFLTSPCNTPCALGNQSWARNCTDSTSTFHLPSFACNGTHTKTNSCFVVNCSSSHNQESMETQERSFSLISKAVMESTGHTMTSETDGTLLLNTASIASLQGSSLMSIPYTENSTFSSTVAMEVSNMLHSEISDIPSSILSSSRDDSTTMLIYPSPASSCSKPSGEATVSSVIPQTCLESNQSGVETITQVAVLESSLAISPTSSIPDISPGLKSTLVASKDNENAWALWGECSKTCGGGTKTRFRKCNGGHSCTENIWQSVVCMNEPCPVHGGWSTWSSWSACDQPCNGGWKFSDRICNTPTPRDGGLPCDGVATIKEECNLHICPVNGGWSQWTEWSLCDKPCHSGLRKRYRFCDSPKVKYGGADCIGDRRQENVCNEHACKNVLVNITARFMGEVFTTDLLHNETSKYKMLKAKVLKNAKAIYKNSSVVLGIHIFKFRRGSVFAQFSLEYRELSTFEIVALATYLYEKRIFGTMPIGYWFINSTEVVPAPKDIEAKAATSSVIRVRWGTLCLYNQSCPYNITGYSVAYKKFVDNDAENWNIHVTLPNASYTDVAHLSPYFLYTFRVSAMTHTGLGMPSEYVDARTIQGVPTRPPRDFECKAETTKSIFCDWRDIPQHFRNGEVMSYHICYRRYSRRDTNASRPWHNVTAPFTQRYYTFDNLEVFTRYEFEIHGCTMTGAGPVAWSQAMTHEGVPSSAPWNITVESFAAEHVINVKWKTIPHEEWNGRPFGIALHYSIFKRGPILDLKARAHQVLLNFDQTFYNITGLDVNWALSIQLTAQTMVGEGPFSGKFAGETCRCYKSIYVSWYEKKPYITIDNSGSVTGIFPKLLDDIKEIVCGYCKRYGYPTVYYDRTKAGRSPKRISYQDLNTKISDEVHIHLPITGDKVLTVFEGKYQYIQVYDDTSSVVITLDQMKISKARVLLNLIYKSYPILLIILLFITTTGIVIWLLDQCNNPQEFQKGHFLRGVFNGIWWAFITMTTVGYGDIIPRGCIGRIFSLVWMIVGLVLTSVFISTLSAATTASSINNRVVLYGTKVGVLYGSKEHSLAVRRLAKIFTSSSKGRNFTTSKDVLQAVIDSEVKGALIETNEAAALFDFISENNLLVRKKIDSTKGVGFVLSGGMAGLHSEIRAYVKSNQNVLDEMLKNKTKVLDIQDITSFSNQVNYLSALFNESIWLSFVVFGTLFLLGLLWHSCLWRCMKNLQKTHPWTKEKSIQEKYKADSEELINLVDSFAVNHIKRIEGLFEEQMRERFQLVISHSKTTPYGPKGWMHYKTLSSRQIMSEIKATELINENLLAHFRKARNRPQNNTGKHPSKLYEPVGIEEAFEPVGFVLENVEK